MNLRGHRMIKAALINILMVTVAKMTVFTAKGVTSSDKLTEDYHSTLAVANSILVSFSIYYSCSGQKL